MDTTETPPATTTAALADDSDFMRLPGLFRRWELPDVVELGPDYRFEAAGTTEDGTPLVAIYVRDHASAER